MWKEIFVKVYLFKKKLYQTLLIISLLWVCFSPPLLGEEKKTAPTQKEAGMDTDQPIHIKSDKLMISRDTSIAEFIGNVVAIQGNTTIKADKLKIHYKQGTNQKSTNSEEALEKIIASGNVKINFDNRLAVTNEAVYITENRTLTLTGPNTKIVSGKDTIIGEKITYRRDDGFTEVESGKSGPVTMELFPGKKGLN